MTRTARPGLVLATGLALGVAAGVAPAGLRGGHVPGWSWTTWAAVLVVAALLARASDRGVRETARALMWLAPVVSLLILPAVLFAAKGRGSVVGLALFARALSSAAVTFATVGFLGPPGVVAGARALRVPARLVDVVHAMLVAWAAIARQVAGMQRARAARRACRGAFAALAAAPMETIKGFGGLTAALLLRSMERAESLERARLARGGGEP
jgi:energy-coupling factor transporter transmembrane protein EcfT